MKNIISLKNVRKDFKDNVALKDLTFDVFEGEIFGFLGPSGAGKTTTIKILTSQLIASNGEVSVLEENANNLKKDKLRQIGVLTDNSGLYERLSVEDNVKFFSNIYGVKIINIDEILTKVDLLESKKKEVRNLSKGMKQRLKIAVAILHKPKLLFLDEPTSSLDPGTMQQIHKLLKEINKEGTTIFLTTHNMEEADKLCDRVAFLNEGEIVELDSPSEIKLKYINDDIKIILKDNHEPLMIKSNIEGAELINQLIKDNKLLSIHSMEPNLEDVFLTLTGRGL